MQTHRVPLRHRAREQVREFRACQHLWVDLSLSRLEGEAIADGMTEKPFLPDPGFREHWWSGIAKGAVVFYTFTTPAWGEVARAQVRLQSTLGEAYPTFTQARLGSTEIELLEVRADLQGKGVGRAAVVALVTQFPPPCVALSLDPRSDEFWRSIGWTEHVHPDDRGRALFVHPG